METDTERARRRFNRVKRETLRRGKRIASRGKRGFFSILFSRSGLIGVMLLAQLILFVALSLWIQPYASKYFLISGAIGGLVVLYIINSRSDSTAKITWLFLILLMPLFGIALYIYTQTDIGHRRLKRRAAKIIGDTKHSIPQDPRDLDALSRAGSDISGLVSYMNKTGCYPVYRNEGADYLPSGEAFFRSLLDDLSKARRFIFLEFFIIDEGLMWGQVLKILAEKVKAGVEVRVLYDGTCEFARLPSGYPDYLRSLGIQCKVFSPIYPFVSTKYNYRDHRKIVVIDGETGFTGGANLADEYINRIHPYGRWKDAAIRLRGRSVKSLTLLFLQMWHADDGDIFIGDLLKGEDARVNLIEGGFVIPFGDNPMDEEKVAENLYIDMISRADRYVWVMTPYLILDGELEAALEFAADRGVDVRIICPSHSDKYLIHALARNTYRQLIHAGVRVFEWQPGFVHSKVMVSDSEKAIVGSINFDYRSLYHHFECGVYCYRTPCIEEIERDFEATFQDCVEFSEDRLHRVSLFERGAGAVLKVISPLL